MQEIAVGTAIAPDERQVERLKERLERALPRSGRSRVRVDVEPPIGAFQFVLCGGGSRAAADATAAPSGEPFDRIVEAAADWALETLTARRLRMHAARLARAGEVDAGEADAFVEAARARLAPDFDSSTPLPHLRGVLQGRLADALRATSRVVVDGVVRFRCPQVARAVDGAANQTLDEYRRRKVRPRSGRETWELEELTEGETRAGTSGERISLEQDAELLALLRGFVGMRDVKSGEVHVLSNPDGPPGRFAIYDANGDVVETEYLEGIPADWIESEVEYQDLLMSALISLAPSHIRLHLAPNSEVVADVRRVFGARAEVCSGCETCDAGRPERSQRASHRRGRAGS